MSATPMRLTAVEARGLMNLKKEAFIKTLGLIRQMVDTNIRDASRRGRESIDFDVPQSLFGRESYDSKYMGKALAEQLHYEDGYDVMGTPLKLKIKWGDDAKSDDKIKFPRQPDPQPALPFTTEFNRQVTVPQARKVGGVVRKTSMAIK